MPRLWHAEEVEMFAGARPGYVPGRERLLEWLKGHDVGWI